MTRYALDAARASDNIPQVLYTHWALIAVPTAILGGFLMAVLICATRGGYRGGLGHVMKNEARQFAWLALLDGIGGAILAVGVWLASPSRFTTIPNLSVDKPWAFWSMIGLVGPLCAYGFVYRGAFNFGFRVKDVDDSPRWRSLRRMVTRHLYTAIDDEVEVRETCYEQWVVRCVGDGYENGTIEFTHLCRAIERKFPADGSGNPDLPPHWNERKAEWQRDASRTVVESLVWSAIAIGRVQAVTRALGIRTSEFSFDDEFRASSQFRLAAVLSLSSANPGAPTFEISDFEEVGAEANQ